MKVDTSKLIFSKAGNLVYRGYYWVEDKEHCCCLEDYQFVAVMQSKKALLEETYMLLKSIAEKSIKIDNFVYLPKGILKPRKGREIIEIELEPDLSDRILNFVETGGSYRYACDTSEAYQ